MREEQNERLLNDDENKNEQPRQVFQATTHIQRTSVSFMQSVWITLSSIEFISLAVLTLHMSTLPLLVRQASKPIVSSNGTSLPVKFLYTTSVLVSEFFKLIICTLLIASFLDKPMSVFQKIYTTIVHQKRETAKVCVPALVYAIQNNLYYVALANLDATTFSVTSQLRILTTAILAVLILKKLLSRPQWGALFLSLVGVVIVQLEKSHSTSLSSIHKDGSATLGLLVTFAISWMSAFAGVYFEKVLKESKTDLWTQNIRLAILTIPFSIITMIVSDGRKILHGGFLQGWTPLVWLVTLLTAVGGILVSLVMKHADNVRKTYCQTVAIVMTVLVSAWIGDVVVTSQLVIGVGVTVSSVAIYMIYPYQPKLRVEFQSPAEVNVCDGSIEEEDPPKQ